MISPSTPLKNPVKNEAITKIVHIRKETELALDEKSLCFFENTPSLKISATKDEPTTKDEIDG